MSKKYIFLLLFSLSLQKSFSQETDTLHYYVDAYEKPTQQEMAIYHIRVYKERPTDSLWKWAKYGKAENNLFASGSTKDPQGKIKHGNFIYYYIDGAKNESRYYENNKKEGEWIQWQDDGKILSKRHYTNGKMTGANITWYDNGNIIDSTILDGSGNGMGYGFYGSGIKRYEGKFTAGSKTGTWNYYYNLPGFPRSMEVIFEADSLVSSKCFDEKGQPLDLCVYEKEAAFIGGEKAWVKYLVKELTDSDYERYLKKAGIYKVMVRFTVSKDGTISSAKVETRGIKKLDKLAEDIILNSTGWEPAIQYNQKVNAYRRQPFTFAVRD